MKKIVALAFLILFVPALFAQSGEVQEEKKKEETVDTGLVKVKESEGLTEIRVGHDGFIQVIDQQDTIKVKIGKKGLRIVGGDSGTRVDIVDLDEENDVNDSPKVRRRYRKYNGHWDGFEIGLSNYLNADREVGPTAADWFMDLNTGKSLNFNLNMVEFGIGLGGRSVGLTTGLGFELNNYRFDNPITLKKDQANNNVIIPFDYSTAFTPPIYPDKTKLTTSYLVAPLILEFQVPTSEKWNPVYLGVGVVGGLKIGSHTKVVYNDGGSREKDKVRDDFNLSPFRYGLTARIGYKSMGFYASYYLSPMFENNRGPELYPVSIGLSFTH